MRSRSFGRLLGVGLLLSSLGGALHARAEPPGESESASDEIPAPTGNAAPVQDAAPVPAVGLDALLKLPSASPTSGSPRAQDGESEWRARFAHARGELTAAEAALAEAQRKLEELASARGTYQVAAPGAQAGSDTGPLSFGLRQEIRRQREAVERAQHQLDELRIEANLAGVPEAWMGETSAAP